MESIAKQPTPKMSTYKNKSFVKDKNEKLTGTSEEQQQINTKTDKIMFLKVPS